MISPFKRDRRQLQAVEHRLLAAIICVSACGENFRHAAKPDQDRRPPRGLSGGHAAGRFEDAEARNSLASRRNSPHQSSAIISPMDRARPNSVPPQMENYCALSTFHSAAADLQSIMMSRLLARASACHGR